MNAQLGLIYLLLLKKMKNYNLISHERYRLGNLFILSFRNLEKDLINLFILFINLLILVHYRLMLMK